MAAQSLTASSLKGGFALIGSLCFPAKAGDTVEIKATANATGGEDQLLLFFDDQQGSFDSFGKALLVLLHLLRTGPDTAPRGHGRRTLQIGLGRWRDGDGVSRRRQSVGQRHSGEAES